MSDRIIVGWQTLKKKTNLHAQWSATPISIFARNKCLNLHQLFPNLMILLDSKGKVLFLLGKRTVLLEGFHGTGQKLVSRAPLSVSFDRSFHSSLHLWVFDSENSCWMFVILPGGGGRAESQPSQSWPYYEGDSTDKTERNWCSALVICSKWKV